MGGFKTNWNKSFPREGEIKVGEYFVFTVQYKYTCDPMPILPSFNISIAYLYPSPNSPSMFVSGTCVDVIALVTHYDLLVWINFVH